MIKSLTLINFHSDWTHQTSADRQQRQPAHEQSETIDCRESRLLKERHSHPTHTANVLAKSPTKCDAAKGDE